MRIKAARWYVALAVVGVCVGLLGIGERPARLNGTDGTDGTDLSQCPITSAFERCYGSAFDPPGGAIVLDLPPEFREPNYAGGSCGHASMVTLLRSMGMPEMADWWRRTYRGGESLGGAIKKMEAAGLSFAYTSSGDMRFLEQCNATGRGAVIFYKPRHIVNFVGLDDQYVYVLDNNATGYPERNGRYERVPRESFAQAWRQHYGGRAWTLVYRPFPVPSL